MEVNVTGSIDVVSSGEPEKVRVDVMSDVVEIDSPAAVKAVSSAPLVEDGDAESEEEVTVIDPSDITEVSAYLINTDSSVQFYNPNTQQYTPDYREKPLIISPFVYIEGETENLIGDCEDIEWTVNDKVVDGTGIYRILDNGSLEIRGNNVSDAPLKLSFRCNYLDKVILRKVEVKAKTTIIKAYSDSETVISDVRTSTWGDMKNVEQAVDKVSAGKYGLLMQPDGKFSLFELIIKEVKALTILLNGVTQGPWDGSDVKSIDITAQKIGAAPEHHVHNQYLTSDALKGFVDEKFVRDCVSTVIGGAPVGYDTLKEIADQLVRNINSITELERLVKALQDGKVDKKTGFGLSRNDFTDRLKEYLERLIILYEQYNSGGLPGLGGGGDGGSGGGSGDGGSGGSGGSGTGGSGTGGGQATLQQDITVTTDRVGYFSRGHVVTKGKTWEQIFREMLSQKAGAQVTASYNGGGSSASVAVGTKRGKIVYTAVRNANGDITAVSYDGTPVTPIPFGAESNSRRTAERQLTGYFTTKGTENFRCTVTFDKGELDREAVIPADVSVNVCWRWYGGVVSKFPTSSSELKNMPSGLLTGNSFTFSVGKWKMYTIAIPAELSITDLRDTKNLGNKIEDTETFKIATIELEIENLETTKRYKLYNFSTPVENDPNTLTVRVG